MSTTPDPIVIDDSTANPSKNGSDKESPTNKEKNATVDKPQKVERTKRASVWDEFERVDKNGIKKAKCNHCGSILQYNTSATTTTLRRHLNNHCSKRNLIMKRQGMLNFQPDGSNVGVNHPDLVPAIVNGKYDPMRMRESIAHWILMHEHSFSVVEEEGSTL